MRDNYPTQQEAEPDDYRIRLFSFLPDKPQLLVSAVMQLCLFFLPNNYQSILKIVSKKTATFHSKKPRTPIHSKTIIFSVAATINVSAYPYAVAISQDYAYVANRDPELISKINIVTDTVGKNIELDRYPLALALGAD